MVHDHQAEWCALQRSYLWLSAPKHLCTAILSVMSFQINAAFTLHQRGITGSTWGLLAKNPQLVKVQRTRVLKPNGYIYYAAPTTKARNIAEEEKKTESIHVQKPYVAFLKRTCSEQNEATKSCSSSQSL